MLNPDHTEPEFLFSRKLKAFCFGLVFEVPHLELCGHTVKNSSVIFLPMCHSPPFALLGGIDMVKPFLRKIQRLLLVRLRETAGGLFLPTLLGND